MRLVRPLAVVGASVAVVLAVSAFGGSVSALKKSHLTLIERPITIFVDDSPPKGPSVGDERTFHQELLFSNGTHAGTFDGSTTNSLEQGTGAAAREFRIGVIQYSLGGGTIVAGGVYSAAPGVVVPKGGVTRAVIGGTGKYLGANGQVVQTPLANGNIKNVFTLLTP